MAKPLGYVLQRSNSPIDGQPIVVIMTMATTNRKTGNMAQVWILREDINPVEALKTGADQSICGSCPHRKQEDGSRSCYVNVGQAPNSIYKAYKAGRYGELKDLAPSILMGRKIRWGAYGDPAVIDPVLVSVINSHAAGHTGYTHQWREEFAAPFKGLFMASCDGFNDYLEANDAGWKTFSVVPKGYKPSGIKLCPATVVSSQATCATCSLCNGAKASIYVEAHGTGSKYVTNIT